MDTDTKAQEILNFQIRRDITGLYKRFLVMVEDLQQEHSSMLRKLKQNLPPEKQNLVDAADYFKEDKFNSLRKRILDSGNESLRGIEEQLKQFDVSFGTR